MGSNSKPCCAATWRFRLSVLRSLLVAVCLLSVGVATGAELSNDEIIRRYGLIAFGQEYNSAAPEIINKRINEVKVWVENTDKTHLEKYIWDILIVLHDITGLEFNDTQDVSAANLLIFLPNTQSELFDAVKLLRKLGNAMEDDVGCLFVNFFEKQGEIEESVIVVPTIYNDIIIKNCLIEELVQSLGLSNDSVYINGSLFNDKELHESIPDGDRRMLKIHYDPRIYPGMGKYDALFLARKILREEVNIAP